MLGAHPRPSQTTDGQPSLAPPVPRSSISGSHPMHTFRKYRPCLWRSSSFWEHEAISGPGPDSAHLLLFSPLSSFPLRCPTLPPPFPSPPTGESVWSAPLLPALPSNPSANPSPSRRIPSQRSHTHIRDTFHDISTLLQPVRLPAAAAYRWPAHTPHTADRPHRTTASRKSPPATYSASPLALLHWLPTPPPVLVRKLGHTKICLSPSPASRHCSVRPGSSHDYIQQTLPTTSTHPSNRKPSHPRPLHKGRTLCLTRRRLNIHRIDALPDLEDTCQLTNPRNSHSTAKPIRTEREPEYLLLC